MGVERYHTSTGVLWKFDEWFEMPDGRRFRVRRRRIPSKEAALAIIAKIRAVVDTGEDDVRWFRQNTP